MNVQQQQYLIPKHAICDSESLKKFPSIYKSALESTIESLETSGNFSYQKIEIIQKFGEKFVIISSLLEIKNRAEEDLKWLNIPLPRSRGKTLAFTSKKYMDLRVLLARCYWKPFILSNIEDEKIWHNILYEPKKMLNFPHWDIADTKNVIDSNCVKPLSKEVTQLYERMCFLHDQLIRDDLPTAECAGYLKEISDEETVIGIFEFRLGWKLDCLKKEFWKLYIQFLKRKPHRQFELLNVYRRYTRFFVEDKVIVDKYRAEIQRISKLGSIPVSEFWIDTILFEKDFGISDGVWKALEWALANVPSEDLKKIKVDNPELHLDQVFKLLKSADPINMAPESEELPIELFRMPPKPPITCYFPKSQIKKLKESQNFGLPRVILFYDTQNSGHKLLRKFFHSCKYFFASRPTPLCHRLLLWCRESSKYREESLFLNDKDLMDFPGLQNLYLTSTLDIYTENPKAFSELLRKLHKNDATWGYIKNQDMTFDEYQSIYNSFYSKDGRISAFSSNVFHEGVKYPWHPDLMDIIFPKNDKIELQ